MFQTLFLGAERGNGGDSDDAPLGVHLQRTLITPSMDSKPWHEMT